MYLRSIHCSFPNRRRFYNKEVNYGNRISQAMNHLSNPTVTLQHYTKYRDSYTITPITVILLIEYIKSTHSKIV